MGKPTEGWAADEFGQVSLGDKRLSARLITLCDRFSDSPESPINQACADWAETKAAYRFFQNEGVAADAVMEAHRRRTAGRAECHATVLAIQDTSFFVYTSHSKTSGLGRMSMKKGARVPEIFSMGLAMHARRLAVTSEGVPPGLPDQKIFVRELRPENERRRTGGKRVQDMLPVEMKESCRWIGSMTAAKASAGSVRVVTVCDREADFHDFFKHADGLDAPVLVRASRDRTVNRRTRCAEKGVSKLWDHMGGQPAAGTCLVGVPGRAKTKRFAERTARTAVVNVSFARFTRTRPGTTRGTALKSCPTFNLTRFFFGRSPLPTGMNPRSGCSLRTCRSHPSGRRKKQPAGMVCGGGSRRSSRS